MNRSNELWQLQACYDVAFSIASQYKEKIEALEKGPKDDSRMAMLLHEFQDWQAHADSALDAINKLNQGDDE